MRSSRTLFYRVLGAAAIRGKRAVGMRCGADNRMREAGEVRLLARLACGAGRGCCCAVQCSAV